MERTKRLHVKHSNSNQNQMINFHSNRLLLLCFGASSISRRQRVVGGATGVNPSQASAMSNAIDLLESDETSHSSSTDSDTDFLPKEATSTVVRRRIIVIDDPSSSDEDDIDSDSSPDSLLVVSPYEYRKNTIGNSEEHSSLSQSDDGNDDTSSEDIAKEFENLNLSSHQAQRSMPVDHAQERHNSSKKNDFLDFKRTDGEDYDTNVKSPCTSEMSPAVVAWNNESTSSRHFTPTSVGFNDSERTERRNRSSTLSHYETESSFAPNVESTTNGSGDFIILDTPSPVSKPVGEQTKQQRGEPISSRSQNKKSFGDDPDECAWSLDSFNDAMYLSSHRAEDAGVNWPEISVPCDLYERLYPHQKIGVQWMASMHINGIGGILGDDMVSFQCCCLLHIFWSMG